MKNHNFISITASLIFLICHPFSDIFFRAFAWYAGNNEKFLNRLIRYSSLRPYQDIDGYMLRRWLMPRFLLVPDEYGRLAPPNWFPISVRLHYIMREDAGIYPHDHPADYRTIILTDWYIEKDVNGLEFLRRAGTTKRAKATNYHHISEISEKGVWTIFIMGPHYNQWGFLKDGVKIPAKDHIASL